MSHDSIAQTAASLQAAMLRQRLVLLLLWLLVPLLLLVLLLQLSPVRCCCRLRPARNAAEAQDAHAMCVRTRLHSIGTATLSTGDMLCEERRCAAAARESAAAGSRPPIARVTVASS